MKVNKFLTPMQHGFLLKSSTLTAQLSCCNDWFEALDNGNWIDVISLDYLTVSVIKCYCIDSNRMALMTKCVHR